MSDEQQELQPGAGLKPAIFIAIALVLGVAVFVATRRDDDAPPPEPAVEQPAGEAAESQ